MSGTRFLLGAAVIVFGYGGVSVVGVMARQSNWVGDGNQLFWALKIGVLVIGCLTMSGVFARQQ